MPTQHLPIDPAKVHVLVVEDNVANFILIAKLLASMGIEKYEWKTTGWGVVEYANTMDRVDLILMDLRLPHEDGYQALRQIRATPSLKDTTVVVVTALSGTAEMEKAREAGFDGFIAKPLQVGRFTQQINQILQGEPVWDAGS